MISSPMGYRVRVFALCFVFHISLLLEVTPSLRPIKYLTAAVS